MGENTIKKALVVGMARSGVAAAALLCREGWKVTVNDSKAYEKLEEALLPLKDFSQVEYALGGPADDYVEGQDLIVVSPGVPLHLPFVKKALARIR